jgi:CTP-dependent riboflavin kinase
MLAKRRRRTVDRTWCLRQLHGNADGLKRPGQRMLSCDIHLACRDVRVGEDLVVVQHRTARDARLLELLEPMRLRSLDKLALDDGDELGIVVDAVGV